MRITGNNYLLFLAYGRPAYLHECTLALLSLCRVMNAAGLAALEVCIYTDKPEWFAAFPDCPLSLQIRTLLPEQAQEWRGAADYLHRVKSAVINDFAGSVSGNIIFMDTDVWVMQSLAHLYSEVASGKRFMHVCEGIIRNGTNPILKKTAQFLAHHPVIEVAGHSLSFKPDLELWNSGVLGFRTADKQLLEEILKFSDAVHPLYKKHITEQLAVSYYFGREGRIHNTTAYVLHYWSLSEAKPMLASFFSFFKGASWSDLVHYSQLIPLPVLIQEKTSFYINRSLAGKIKKAQWEPQIPDWQRAIQQLT